MTANKVASRRTLKSDLARVDAQVIRSDEYDDAPELTDAMSARGVFKHAGRPVAGDPRHQVTIRLPASVFAAGEIAERSGKPAWRAFLRQTHRARHQLDRP